MTKAAVIKATEEFVRKRLATEGTGHDYWHIHRVRNNARMICRTEKADRFIVDLAVLLHDVGDRKVLGTEEDDYSIAENFLRRQKVPTALVERVMFIIQHMSFSKSLHQKRDDAPMEFRIVQDADRLDALGAIGIARTFAYGGAKARLLYDPTAQPKRVRSTSEYRKLKSSSLHHFAEKLFHLRDLMNTKTARKIATQRHEYMRQYLKQFLLEWDGKR